MLRIILHLDADAFFASVEQAADPRLRGKPVAVGGEKRGIIASASYEARRFGIHTPMPTSQARKLCPKLILLPGDFEKYERFSRWMFSYAYDFTPDVEITSIDEGYFDLTGTRRAPATVAQTIRRAIGQALKISVSEGLASNKLVSQIASKLHKPAAFLQVDPGQEIAFLHPLPNCWLPGVGPQTAARLNAAGLPLIGQIATTPLELLQLLLGRWAVTLHQFAQGIDDRPIIAVSTPPKSYSHQETFPQDQTDETFLEATLRHMADSLMAQVRADGKSIRTLTVKVRYNDMDEDQCGESLLEPTDLETDLYPRLRPLLRQAWKRRVSLRLLSLRLSHIYDSFYTSALPLERTAQQHDARRRLADIIDDLRHKHGPYIILRGHDLLLRDQHQNINHLTTPTPPLAQTFRLRPHRKTAPSKTFLPLAVHSYYSFLNSTLSIQNIVALAKHHHLPAITLTDQANLHGAVEFAQKTKSAGLHPILGAELRLADQLLWLYVENATGYRNLCTLLSRKEKERNNAEGRTQETENQTATLSPNHSALCISPSALSQTDGLLAVSSNTDLIPLFPGRFYFAVTSPAALRKLGRSQELPAVAVLPIHYATPAARWKFDIVQSIRTLTLLQQEHSDKQLTGAFHFRSPAEISALFPDHPELLAQTMEIAERCTFELPLGPPQFPAFTPPDGSTPGAFLRRLVFAGLQRRYGNSQLSTLNSQIKQELAIIHDVGYEEYFLVVWDLLQQCRQRGIEWITRGSAADSLVCYCLGISDVCPIRFDLYFHRFLNQERMSMHKLPDIDIDFPHDRKDDVINLIFEKYGSDHAAVVGGFSTFQARSAVADIAKVLGVSEHQIRRFTQHFPWTYPKAEGEMQNAELDAANTTAAPSALEQSLRASPDCPDLPLEEDPYKTALAMAEFLDGFPRYPKMHPCGVVLSRQPMHELTPTFISQKGYPTTHFDMDAVEAIGLVKIDILAQGGLAVMRDVKTMLARRGITVDLQQCEARQEKAEGKMQNAENTPPHPGPLPQIPPQPAGGERETCTTSRAREHLRPAMLHAQEYHSTPHPPPPPSPPLFGGKGRGEGAAPLFNDSLVWDMIASGSARAVHHIESPAMVSLCRMTHVQDIDGLIAIVSVIRPGAANEQKKLQFTRRYQGLEPVTYPHPSLEPFLKSTFGLVVYEEHILQICTAFAGLPLGRADTLRRALVKLQRSVIEEIEKEFFAAARARGHDEAKIAEVWNLVRGFAGYAFCKAHSTAYGVEAYQSAWLKRYFPAEFMAAVLTHGKGFYHPLVYVLECHRLGIPLLTPCVNAPGPQFTVEERMQNGEAPSANQSAEPSAFRIPSSALPFIRVPATRVKGLTERTQTRLVEERQRGEFESLRDFYRRVVPLPEEMEALLRAGAFDNFGQSRTTLFWEIQFLRHTYGPGIHPAQGWLFPPGDKGEGKRQKAEEASADRFANGHSASRTLPSSFSEPSHRERLEWETNLLGFTVSGHPLELHDNIAWDTYCPVARLDQHIGQTVVTCGLVIEQRLHHQATGEPMKFLTLADWTGLVETELFAPTYRSYGLATVRYPVLEVTATVEPFENGRGFTLRVHRAGRPRTCA